MPAFVWPMAIPVRGKARAPSWRRLSRRARRAGGEAVDLYWGSGLCDDAPALAWFLVSALVPLALGLTALASIVLGDHAEAQALAERAARLFPEGVSDQLVQVILRTQSDSPLLLAGSIALMVWTSSGAVGVLERSMSRLAGRDRFGLVVGKARHLGMAGGVALVVMLMVLAGSKATGLQARLGVDGAAIGWLLAFAALAATTALCASLYRWCPRGGLPWRAATAGAAPTALALQLVPIAASFYIAWVAGRTPVQVFLVLAGVMFTCYLAAVALLVGAGLAVRSAGALAVVSRGRSR
jgi:uncharacterized BrkB/YihY/UPF0761 family membrane protein